MWRSSHGQIHGRIVNLMTGRGCGIVNIRSMGVVSQLMQPFRFVEQVRQQAKPRTE
jgi:hypothetical protein